MAQPTAVILNDTATRYHHGCARVMRLLVAGLEGQGFIVTARSPARHDWTRDASILNAMKAAQVIVINGEGTLHDGAAAGAKLLSVTDHPARGAVPVALVNALYEQNPADWDARVASCSLLSARDSKSAAALSKAVRRSVGWMSDLSLTAPANVSAVSRKWIIVGDSVRLDRRRLLANAAQRLGAVYVPTKTLRSPLWRNGLAKHALWRVYNGTFSGPVPPFDMAIGEADYLARIAGAQGHVTGRFHAVCLSMLTGTPFLALASTTSKIETLLMDSGLGRDRLIDAEGLNSLTRDEATRPFSVAETEAIRATLDRAAAGAARLFADIRSLA